MLLATDLDGTFIGGEHYHRQQLYDIIRSNSFIKLVFVSGRGIESVISLFENPAIPRPEYIIGDVGATIVDGETLEAVQPLQEEIEQKWPGHLEVKRKFEVLKGLRYQEVPQHHRCSFFVSDTSLLPDAKRLAAELECDVIYSAGKFLDVLPGGVNKGSSVTRLVNFLNINREDVLVAGDTLNDLTMYQYDLKGVVVGEAEKHLIDATKNIPFVYHAKLPGAGGILEALHHFEQFRMLMPTLENMN